MPSKRHLTTWQMEFYPQPPLLYLPSRVHMNIFTFHSAAPHMEFMTVMPGFELCYVSAETAWPHALEPCTALWPDKTDIFPRGCYKSGLYF